jgi:hypothetical protein
VVLVLRTIHTTQYNCDWRNESQSKNTLNSEALRYVHSGSYVIHQHTYRTNCLFACVFGAPLIKHESNLSSEFCKLVYYF